MFVISFVGDSANVLVNVVGVHVIMPRNSKHETQRVTTKAEKRGSVKLKKKTIAEMCESDRNCAYVRVIGSKHMVFESFYV
jgi:hypothetical protein